MKMAIMQKPKGRTWKIVNFTCRRESSGGEGQ